ncbi:M23 family metallopeptidase [uncultured Psychroserpens sp.]|uniref:M23 family metallopeptidase n=1 Tax=uncultured Psychroserpens sp. TaxID=255436 RepID=UPI002629254A|nr:M23 family metallopeptidase [uncultured Psychroserpens sp.]
MKQLGLSIIIFLFHCGLHAQEVSFTKSETDSLLTYTLVNHTYAPITLSVKKLSELDAGIDTGDFICSPKDSLVEIFKFPKAIATDSSFKVSTHLKLSMAYGKKLHKDSIKHVDYELPFLKGKRYKVIQAYGGRLSHRSDQSYYAIDFKMPIGDTVVAARRGRVIRTVDHFTEHGGASYRDKANQILIYHDDGTIAFYVHLNTNGVLVNLGDIVEAGQPIGISGHTGYSTTPHLHFVIRNFRSAIPIQFKEKKDLGKRSGVWAKKPQS